MSYDELLDGLEELRTTNQGAYFALIGTLADSLGIMRAPWIDARYDDFKPHPGQDVLVYATTQGRKMFVTDCLDPSWHSHWMELPREPNKESV